MRLISRRSADALTDLWLAGPATLAMLVLIFIPVAIVAMLSFTDYQFGARSFNWVGFDNYTVLVTDPQARRAITLRGSSGSGLMPPSGTLRSPARAGL